MNPQQGLPLADIQLAEPVSAWPPAIGWWLLAALIITLLASLLLWLIKRHRLKGFGRQACAHLKQRGETLSLQELNELLKVTALHYCPQPHLAGLTGARWHKWLLNHCSSKHQEAMTQLTATLEKHQYAQSEPSQQQLQQLHHTARLWLKQAWRLSKIQEANA